MTEQEQAKDPQTEEQAPEETTEPEVEVAEEAEAPAEDNSAYEMPDDDLILIVSIQAAEVDPVQIHD